MKRLDLNLLPTLQALLEMRNVSRAAEKLAQSQPATSAALAKLRRFYDDELLVRVGRGYELTPFAQELLPVLNDTLRQVRRSTDLRNGFDATNSQRRFIIAASDYAATLMVGPLRGYLKAEAPGVSIDFVANSTMSGDPSDSARIDLFIGPPDYRFAGHRKVLFRDTFVAITDASNPLLDMQPPTLEDLAAAPNAVGSFGEGILTPADRLFADRSITRNVVAVVSAFLPLPLLVENTDLVALLPRMHAARACRGANLGIIDLSGDLEAELIECMFWLPSQHEDPANVWLRDVVLRSCAGLHERFPIPETTRQVQAGTITRTS